MQECHTDVYRFGRKVFLIFFETKIVLEVQIRYVTLQNCLLIQLQKTRKNPTEWLPSRF